MQTMRHLGLILDTARGLFLVPSDKAARVRMEAQALRTTARSSACRIPARRIASFCGLANSIGLAIRPARFYLRALFNDMQEKQSWASHVRLSRQALHDLHWWSKLDTRWNGRAIWKPPTAMLATDSSDYGWGAELTRPVAPKAQVLLARRFWPEHHRSLHINVKELMAIRMALSTFVA